MPAFPLIHILAIGLIILVNGFFATVEFALVSARRTWLQQKAAQGDSRAEAALQLIGNLNAVVSGTQVGITITSLALGWVGEITVARLLESIGGSTQSGNLLLIHTAATTVAFLGLTFLHVVLGELVPKQVALARAERVSLLVAWPMKVFLRIVQAPQALLHASAYSLAQHLGARHGAGRAHTYTGEELKLLVTASFRGGTLPAYQQDMIHSVIDLRQVAVREIMVPRPNIVSVSVHSSLEEVLRVVTEELHSRLPVYEHTPEQIIGVLYAKDLFRVWREQQEDRRAGRPSREFVLRSRVRDISVVPENKPIVQLLQEFQQRRRHMALVVDEFGNTVGLVTIEDVLEQIVGEIQDEYDWERPPGLRLGERTLVLEGHVNILDLENQYEIVLPRDEGFETLAGFVLYQLGHIPRPGESFLYQNWRFTVAEVENHRVAQVRLDRVDAVPVPEAERRENSKAN
ncbi:MAG: HlyC/CorC family transporter [Acidobacteria bacterium]|nr:HlyC/CorC family transporter [Acidobacteriota bacterium]